ncbi:MAG: hypothetical protein ACFFAN_00190 [Promethearchaeota archaeon]
MKGLKKHFSSSEQIFKKVGKEGEKEIQFSYWPKIFKKLNKIKGSSISKIHLEIFRNYYASYDILQPNVEISIIETDSKNKKAVYRFKNSEFLKDSDDYIYHIYIACGVFESIFARELKQPVVINVDKIYIDDSKKENSYFDISIKFK